jgi:Asp-tRNA(Asn)/Glu-tRNA(Gln) amidotransferase A subunit family amidase
VPDDTIHASTPQPKAAAKLVIASAQVGGLKSIQWTNSKDQRATSEDVKTRLEKAEEDLKKVKADLKAWEMQARSRKERLAKYTTAEEES